MPIVSQGRPICDAYSLLAKTLTLDLETLPALGKSTL